MGPIIASNLYQQTIFCSLCPPEATANAIQYYSTQTLVRFDVCSEERPNNWHGLCPPGAPANAIQYCTSQTLVRFAVCSEERSNNWHGLCPPGATADAIQYCSSQTLVRFGVCSEERPNNWHGYEHKYFSISPINHKYLKSQQGGKLGALQPLYQTNNAPVSFQ
ncbi:hypothetical protein CDAR_296391 [Caerostris darwini]|uniref:Uncharacterized protein n=1 Tax=Caerostris darwini TaxID=1538125 RepID=A0AAV4PM42_9ARAC|nr:hypothetical protein CDAR_296391 [Caerostris darwini]